MSHTRTERHAHTQRPYPSAIQGSNETWHMSTKKNKLPVLKDNIVKNMTTNIHVLPQTWMCSWDDLLKGGHLLRLLLLLVNKTVETMKKMKMMSDGIYKIFGLWPSACYPQMTFNLHQLPTWFLHPLKRHYCYSMKFKQAVYQQRNLFFLFDAPLLGLLILYCTVLFKS